jgi:hypothetical protein
MDFCDVHAYPELFVPEVRIDHAHLNATGAELFTRMIATQFLDIARTQSAAAPPSSPTPR